jgi:hypothetical protein
MSNVLQANLASASATSTVEEVKASLGSNKFKQLKRLTKSFAEAQLSPEGYVDQAAALFDRGYGDPNFWSFLPSLLETCPNQQGAERAQNYMVSLRHQQFTTKSRSTPAPAPAPSNWGSGNARNNVMKKPPTAARPLTQPVIGRHNVVVPSKKKNAWGATGAATVVRAKAPPGSVASAAAAQGPRGGTATKFMAKEQKEQKKQPTNQPKANGNKNKASKNELRSLAFGK